MERTPRLRHPLEALVRDLPPLFLYRWMQPRRPKQVENQRGINHTRLDASSVESKPMPTPHSLAGSASCPCLRCGLSVLSSQQASTLAAEKCCRILVKTLGRSAHFRDSNACEWVLFSAVSLYRALRSSHSHPVSACVRAGRLTRSKIHSAY